MSNIRTLNEENIHDPFICKKCDYKCRDRYNYNRHISTAKHRNTPELELVPRNEGNEGNEGNDVKNVKNVKHICKCGKTYASRSALWYHKKRCVDNIDSSKKVNRVLPVSHNFISEPDDTTMSDTIQAMVNAKVEEHISKMGDPSITKLLEAQAQAHAAQADAQAAQADAHAAAAAEQTRLLIEAISLKGPQYITNNTTNNQFNLNVFLNEDCKDAYTLKEVMDSIVCTVSDLDRMDNDGYVATITRKILESIQNMSITERPIHCTDARRNTVCAKDESGWERNEKAMKMLADSVFKVGQKLGRMVDDWRVAYPDHFRGTATRRDQYHRLVTNIMRVHDLDVEARIVSKVCKGVILDRKTVMER